MRDTPLNPLSRGDVICEILKQVRNDKNFKNRGSKINRLNIYDLGKAHKGMIIFEINVIASNAKQSLRKLHKVGDCFVTSLLAMTKQDEKDVQHLPDVGHLKREVKNNQMKHD